MYLSPSGALPETLDVRVALTDPCGRETVFVDRSGSEGDVRMRLDYLFGAFRGFLYPYRLSVSGIRSGNRRHSGGVAMRVHAAPASPPGPAETGQRSARPWPIPDGRGRPGRYRVAGDAGERRRRGGGQGHGPVADSDEMTFDVAIGEVPRGRYRLRLTPMGSNPDFHLECPCNVMGARHNPLVLLGPKDVARLRRSGETRGPETPLRDDESRR